MKHTKQACSRLLLALMVVAPLTLAGGDDIAGPLPGPGGLALVAAGVVFAIILARLRK